MFETKFIKKIKTPTLCSIIFLNPSLYEIIWKNIVEVEMPRVKQSETA